MIKEILVLKSSENPQTRIYILSGGVSVKKKQVFTNPTSADLVNCPIIASCLRSPFFSEASIENINGIDHLSLTTKKINGWEQRIGTNTLEISYLEKVKKDLIGRTLFGEQKVQSVVSLETFQKTLQENLPPIVHDHGGSANVRAFDSARGELNIEFRGNCASELKCKGSQIATKNTLTNQMRYTYPGIVKSVTFTMNP